MTTIESTSRVLGQAEARPFTLGEDHLAAVGFLARYRGRTLEAYRHDLRNLFQWAADHDLAVLEADSNPPGVLSDLDGGARPGGLHHRRATVHRLRVLPIRPH
jgi:hypothetical protein